MVQLQEESARLRDAEVQVVGISYDDVGILKTFSDANQIAFPLLSDTDSKTIHAFGLHFKDGLPHPGTVLIDQSGVIRAKIFLEGYRDRHTIDELVSASESIRKQ